MHGTQTVQIVACREKEQAAAPVGASLAGLQSATSRLLFTHTHSFLVSHKTATYYNISLLNERRNFS